MKKKNSRFKLDRKTGIAIGVAALVVIAIIAIAVVLMGRGGGKKDYEKHYESAMVYYISEDYNGALVELALARDAMDTEDCAVLTARCYMAQEMYSKAVDALESWLADNSGSKAPALLAECKELGGQSGAGEKLTIGGKSVTLDSTNLVIAGKALTDEDMDNIAKLTKLKNLSLTKCSVSDLSKLSGLAELESLILSGNTVTDLTPLSGLKNLRTLYLDGNPIESLEPLYSLTTLTTLDIRSREITDVELEALEEALPNCSVFSDTPIEEVREITLGGVTFKSDVTELDLSGKGIDDISKLADCTELSVLNLSDNSISGISVLAYMPKLKSLDLSDNKVADLSPLMSLTGIEYLDLENNAVTKLTPLAAMTGLTELWLGGNKLQSISVLVGMTKLNKLGLQGVGVKDSDLTALASLTALTELHLDDNLELSGNAVTELEGKLANCSITYSDLIYAVNLGTGEYKSTDESVNANGKSVTDLSELSKFTELKTLLLNDNLGLNLKGIKAVTTLEKLSIDSSAVSDISELSSLSKLRVLSASKNRITDLAALSGLPAIEELYLSYNSDLENIADLATCTTLKKLSLNFTGVWDISALSSLTNLTELDLEGCPITDATPLYNLTKLKSLYVGGCELSIDALSDLIIALPDCTVYY